MKVQLKFNSTCDRTEGPAAWFLAGSSSEHLLEELAECGLAEPGTRLFPVPVSVHDRRIAGLLVIPKPGKMPTHSPRGLVCRAIAGRLYVPIDATLTPPLTDSEVQSHCLLPVMFFHPAFGLCGFEEEAALDVSALMDCPEEGNEAWDLASTGIDPLPELSAIVLAQPPSIDELFGGAQNEIGKSSPKDLLPTEGEPGSNPAAQAGRYLQGIIAKGVAAAANILPQSRWMNDLAGWAGRRLSDIQSQLDRIRNKELHRLLDLLKNDPEAGLKHAISLGNQPHRGIAPPSATLGSRIPDFSLGRLGGGPADFWSLTNDWQEILRRKYRELAERELRLGRFRRAAYIYAELLGDFPSAANVLKQGRHFREAALLYEQYLKNPLEAARCLAEGGLLQEAIERYVQLRRWLDVADLYERLDERSQAEVFIRRAVAELLGEDNPIDAARLVEERLHNVDEALQVLNDAWPASQQAVRCLTTSFEILGRLGRHEAARERLLRLKREGVARSMALPLVTGLAELALRYPDRALRHEAADFSRVVIAGQLSRTELDNATAGQWVELLEKLAPEDSLLVRDGNRHLAERRARKVRPTKPGAPEATGKSSVLRRIELPRQIEWTHIRTESHWFFAAGHTANHLTIVRGVWDGHFQTVSWVCPAQAVRRGLIFEPTRENGRFVVVGVTSQPHLGLKTMPKSDVFFNQSCMLSTPGWISPACVAPHATGPTMLAYSFTEEVAWSIHVMSDQATLTCSEKDGELRHTFDLTEKLLSGADTTAAEKVFIAGLPVGTAVALGTRLLIVKPAGNGGPPSVDSYDLPRPVIGLIRTIPHVRAGVTILLEHGVMMHWLGIHGLIEVERDVESPQAAFLHGSALAILSRAHKQVTLLDVDSRGVNKVTRLPSLERTPIAISSTDQVGEYAVLEDTGTLTVYRVG